jgi:hypothetical protein
MAVTFTRDQVYNNETQRWERTDNPVVETVIPAGAVLSSEPYTYHVPSDNAMIDSGNGQRVTYWSKGQVMTEEFCTGREMAGFYTFVIDADDDTRALATGWAVWAGWFAALATTDSKNKERRRKWSEIQHGSRVRVVKGRKVPIGSEWYVCNMGDGQFGPYVHLSSMPAAFGDFKKFINPDNLKVIDPEPSHINYPAPPHGFHDDTLLTLAQAYNALYPRGTYDPDGKFASARRNQLAVLADRCEEIGNEDGAVVLRRAANG